MENRVIDGVVIEVMGMFALAIQHTDHLVLHHEGDGQFRARVARGRHIQRVIQHIRAVNRLLEPSRGPGHTLPEREGSLLRARVPADHAARAQFLSVLVQ